MDSITNEEEIWKPIKNYESYYEISSYGRVKRIRYGVYKKLRKGKILKSSPQSNGYLKLDLCTRNIKTTVRIHELVAETFIGERPEDYEIDHKDNNKDNNRYDNLQYLTHSEHMIKDKSIPNLPRNNKIKEEYLTTDLLQRELGIKYGLATSTISTIIRS